MLTQHDQTFPVNRLVNVRRIRLIFTDPKLRPPVLEEMQPDINRLAASIARIRSDQSSYALGQEDLVAECYYKLALLITRDRIESLPNRFEAFKFIKTVFNNHVKSLVSKHRLTLKRGARRTTSEDSGETNEISLNDNTTIAFSNTKNTELSSDDPDQHMQIADPTSNWSPEKNFIEDIAVYLTPIELSVLKEFSEPSERTRFFAEYDSMVGRKSGGSKSTITFSEKNHADGLGLELSHFKKVLRSLREKLTWIKMNDADSQEIAWNRAIARLEEAFDIQIPKSIEKTIIRRLLTVAAVDQFDKVESIQQIQTDLLLIGAKIPERRAGVMACYGIMYQKNNRTCIACGLQTACRDEAMNFGLGDITLDSRLLGSKQFRIPVVVANSPEPADILSSRDEEIYNYLRSTFNAQVGTKELIFKHKETNGVVVVVQLSPLFEIKIHNPSEVLIPKLMKNGVSYYIPSTISAEDAIQLISEHAHETFISAP
jgi:hypothetical protein